MKEKITVYDVITDRIIKSLENGVAPWRMPWKKGKLSSIGKNAITGYEYRGINHFLTAITAITQGYDVNEWITFKQVSKIPGCKVMKGEHATPILFWTVYDAEKEGKTETRFSARYYNVFNVAQVEGLKEQYEERESVNVNPAFNPIETCENVVDSWKGKPIIENKGARAFYAPGSDIVTMPGKERFEKPEEYYSTLFHELTHSTGHESRLKREGITEAHYFGDSVYSKEELIAEMGAAFLCAHTGIETVTLENSASYVNGWLKVLKGDSKLVISAASKAQKAVDLILGKQFNKESEE